MRLFCVHARQLVLIGNKFGTSGLKNCASRAKHRIRPGCSPLMWLSGCRILLRPSAAVKAKASQAVSGVFHIL